MQILPFYRLAHKILIIKYPKKVHRKITTTIQEYKCHIAAGIMAMGESAGSQLALLAAVSNGEEAMEAVPEQGIYIQNGIKQNK